MTLVVIYGAPGVGKLTTARALAALTGFRIFHNHLSFDLAKAVFEFPTLPFQRLAETVRLATFEAAARENVPGLVFTFGYASPEDDAFVEKMIQVIERHGGELAFVRLYCDRATHERRVLSDQAAQHRLDSGDDFRHVAQRRLHELSAAEREELPRQRRPAVYRALDLVQLAG